MIAVEERCTINDIFDIAKVLFNFVPAILFISLPSVPVASNCLLHSDGSCIKFGSENALV